MSAESIASPALDRVPESGADRPALRRCTSLDPQDFAARVWAREASLSRAASLPRDFGDLFSLDAADAVLSTQGLRTPFVRVARNGATLPAGRFTSGGGTGATIADQASDVRLAQLFADGCTIVLQALHRIHAPVISFAQALAADLGHPVQVNAYLTPPQSQGFAAHYDVHDVFVLQIAGEKRWRIHEPVVQAPLRDQPWTGHRAAVEAQAAREPLIDVVLRPGDALYLPRGFLHAATALGQTSAHLTVGVHVWTRQHLLDQVLRQVTASAGAHDLRSSLPLGADVTDSESLRAELGLAVTALMERLGTVTAAQVAAGLTGEAFAASRAAPVAPLAQAAAAASVAASDRLRWRSALRATLTVDGDELLVTTTDGVVRLPAHAARSVERLQHGQTLVVAELDVPGAGPGAAAARLDLAAALLRSCLAVRA